MVYQHHHLHNCTTVTPQCPVVATRYGYYPSLAANAFFAALFLLCLVAQLILGIKYKTWTFLLGVGLGTFGEGVGYAGRLIMHHNPWSPSGFKIQICCLVLAPSFLAAGIYLILRNLVIFYGPEHSKLKPRLYTWLFIGFDFGSIAVQAIGGGLAAAATTAGKNNTNLLNSGDDLIVAGIALQVATMVACGCCALDFFLRLMRRRKNGRNAISPTENGAAARGEKIGQGVDEDPKVRSRRRILIFAGILSFFTILIRCIYR